MTQYDGSNTTGFVSPAAGRTEDPLDLHDILDLSSPSRFLIKVSGNNLISDHIVDGDYVVVDTALDPQHNQIVVGFVNGDVLISRIVLKSGSWFLHSSLNEQDIEISGDSEIWGIVVSVVRKSLD